MEKELIYLPKKNLRLKSSIFYGVEIFTLVAALSLRFLLKVLQGKSSLAMADRYIDYFWRMHFKHSGTSLYAVGRKYLKPGFTYIFVSNHVSWMDFASLFGAVPGSLRMVAKQGLMQIPIFGHAMKQAGFIAIDRKNRDKAISQLEEAKKRLHEGISIWIAPEGTRSRTGQILPFKKGGFYLALDLKLTIVPVFIEGSERVMPADTLNVHTNQSITVHFLPPIPTEGFDRLSMEKLIAMVRNAIIAKQKEINSRALISTPTCGVGD